MINSLFKDSHITRKSRFQKSPLSESGVQKREPKCAAPEKRMMNNSDIIMKKPAEISFSGLSCAKLANSSELKTIVQKAEAFLKGKSISLKSLVTDSIDLLIPSTKEVKAGVKKEISAEAETFLSAHKIDIQSLVDEAKRLVEDEGKTDQFFKQANVVDVSKKTIGSAIDVFPSIAKHHPIYDNKIIRGLFEKAADSQAVFSALFAIGLTCILRPAAIMGLPGSNKNKDDKKYASAHSIASGVIGYAVSLVAFAPISMAMKRISKNPEFFFKKVFKAGDVPFLKDKKALDAAANYINMLPETILAAPRATVTVALIPPILKYVFGWEKKSKNNNQPSVALQNYEIMNFKGMNARKSFQSFMGETR